MNIVEINKNNFEEEVLKCNKKVLVDFNAEWCGPCKMLKPIIEEIAKENDGIKVASINVDNEPSLSGEYNIFSIPCLIIFENGKEAKRNVGLMSKEEVEKFIGE